MEYVDFLDVCNDVTKTAMKIPQSLYLKEGKYPVFDQGKEYIGGYTNETNSSSDFPYIIFGDHTRILKYINQECFIGADGVKLLKVHNPKFTDKYIYYYLIANPISSQGYSRHYKFLKEIKFKYVDLEKQQKIVDEIDSIFAKIDLCKKQIVNLETIVKSQFIEMFDGKYESEFLHKVCDELFAGGDVKKEIYSSVKSEIYPYPIYTNGEKDNGLYGYTSIYRVDKEAVTISGRGTIGFTCLRNEPFYPAVRLIVAVPNQKIISGCYLKYFIEFKNYGGQGASIPQLTVPMIKNELIPLPPLELQNEFSLFAQQIDKSKFIVQKQIKLLEELLEKKMNEYFGD